jgi:hypothetical protein
MTHFGNEPPALLDDATAERLIVGAGASADPLTIALADLRAAAAARPVPTASPALIELITNGLGTDELARRRRRGRIVLGVAAAATTTLTLSGVAAAHDVLPAPAEGVVTDVVNNLTPFTIERHRATSPLPTPADTVLPTVPGETDTGIREQRGEDHGGGSGRGDDGGTSSGSGTDDGSNSGSGSSGSGDGSRSGSGSGDSGSGGSGSGDSGSGGSGSGDSGSGDSGSGDSGSGGSTDGGSSGSSSGGSGDSSGGGSGSDDH